MAKKTKKPELTHCRVTKTTHPNAPWRVIFPVEENGVTRKKRRMFSTEEKAMDFATETERELSDHGVRFGGITAEARRAFDFYRDARADLLADGFPAPTFETLVRNAVEALRREHADSLTKRLTIAEAVPVFITFKRGAVSANHLVKTESILTKFAAEFGTVRVNRIEGQEVERWISALPGLGPLTRNKYRKCLRSFFAYGCERSQGWADLNPLDGMKREKPLVTEPEAYSLEDAAGIMNAALEMRSPILPIITLCLFSGLRPSEAWSLDLSAIDLAEDGFKTPTSHASGERTKTGSRVAPLTPACKAWLGTVKKLSGRGWSGPRQAFYDEMSAVMTAARVEPIHDGFRHSYITYRTAETRDVARVADECGNSPNVIKKHYRQLVTESAGKAYFAIRPNVAENVSNISEGRATA